MRFIPHVKSARIVLRHALGISALRLGLVVAAASTSGCGALPQAGPSTGDIVQEQGQAVLHPFKLVEITDATLVTLSRRADDGLAARFGDPDTGPRDLPIGAGDGITVTVWEAGSNGIFFVSSGAPSSSGAPASRGTTIPEQIVGGDGTIRVPFAGRVVAAGHTPAEVASAIEVALSAKTQSPQALVTVSRPAANAVTLLGEATGSARVPLTPRGERLLDALAAVGGSRAPVYETRVRLNRSGQTASLPLTRILSDPAENVRLQGGDELVVTREPQTFTAFGATARNAQIPFEAPAVNLVEAIAKAGGLLDQRADPQGVFLFRYEPAEVATALQGNSVGAQPADAKVAVVYRLDLMRAGSYFRAQDFALRDRDVLYVASASANQLQKFLVLLGLITQPVINGVVIDQATQ